MSYCGEGLSPDEIAIRRAAFRLFLRKIFDFLFYALILAAPLVVYGFYTEGISLRLSRFLIIVTAPVALLILSLRPGVVIRDKFLIWGIAPYLIYTSASMIWSPSVETGTTGERLGGLYEVILLYVIFSASNLVGARSEKFIRFYVYSAIVPLAFSLWQIANNLFNFSQAELPFETLLIPGKYELLEGRVFLTDVGISRISSTFAEPVIFSSYISSVILFSLALESGRLSTVILLRVFQAIAVAIMLLSVSKLSILCLLVGFLFISISNRKYLTLWGWLGVVAAALVAALAHFELLGIFGRLLTVTGHDEKLEESLLALANINIFTGDGIGSVPFGSWHRFLISRVYESGIVGLYFVLFVTALPILVWRRKVHDRRAREVRNICVGVLAAVVLGLHLYDYFIHLFPWIVIGGVLALHYHARGGQGDVVPTAV